MLQATVFGRQGGCWSGIIFDCYRITKCRSGVCPRAFDQKATCHLRGPQIVGSWQATTTSNFLKHYTQKVRATAQQYLQFHVTVDSDRGPRFGPIYEQMPGQYG